MLFQLPDQPGDGRGCGVALPRDGGKRAGFGDADEGAESAQHIHDCCTLRTNGGSGKEIAPFVTGSPTFAEFIRSGGLIVRQLRVRAVIVIEPSDFRNRSVLDGC
ncbi:MAG: hypothetical protein ACLPZR_28085 [Solirubrobacteraceae bacterium]